MIPTQSWRAGLKQPDRRPIPDYLHDNWTLPPTYAQPGRFDVSTSRHLIKPFAAAQDDSVREETLMAAVQTGKTLVIEGTLCWAIENSPGPMMWTHQTDDDAKEHCDQRFMEALKSIPHVRTIWPTDRHQYSKTSIYFGPFFLEVNGANRSNLQRVSIRWKFNSECWLWKKGLLDHARSRVTAFEKAGNSKVINESQGGIDGDDFHEAYKSGSQEVWSVRCFGCGLLSPLEFSGSAHADPKRRACVVWNDDARRPDGTWNVGRASETCRYECPACGAVHEDSSRTRARWNADGDYIVQRADAPASRKSFRWEALVARPMADLVAQFIEARRQQKQGVSQAMMDFTQKRRALPWKDDMMAEVVLLRGSGYLLTAETIATKLDGEAARFMTIDRQRDHFWCVVRAWRADGTSRLLYRGRVNTEAQLVEIRHKFDVEAQLVFEDSGYFPNAVYSDCARYAWTALKGSGDNYFTIEKAGRKFKRMWSDATRVLADGHMIPLIHWASDPIKDVLYLLRTGRGALWETADDAGAEYQSQLNGDRKKEFQNGKTLRSEWRWQKTHANHMGDCEAMQVAAALMTGILASPELPPEEKQPL